MRLLRIYPNGCDPSRHVLILIFSTLFLLSVPAGSFAQCELVTHNPASVCEPETIDLTDPSITEGSTSGMIFLYWTDSLGTRELENPWRVTSAGIYYIEGITSTGCSKIKPVIVTIVPLPYFYLDYPPSDLCTGSPPVTPYGREGLNGTFWSAPAGLSLDSITGTVTPAESLPGFYTVYFELVREGDCPPYQLEFPIQISEYVTPVFNPLGPFCLNSEAPVLPPTSLNGIPGNWGPSLISTAIPGSFTFTFTPSGRPCSLNATMVIQIIEDFICPNPVAPPKQTVNQTPDGIYSIPPLTCTDNADLHPVILFSITGATSRSGSGPDASGTFNPGTSQVVWDVADLCGNTAQAFLTVEVIPASGTDPVTRSVSFRLYPNPADQTFTIEIQSLEPEDFTFTLADLTGRILFEKQIVRSSTTIREVIGHPDLAPGTYLARITGSSGTFSRMLVMK